MTQLLTEKIAALSPERQQQIARMTAELIADETAQEVKEWTEIEKISPIGHRTDADINEAIQALRDE